MSRARENRHASQSKILRTWRALGRRKGRQLQPWWTSLADLSKKHESQAARHTSWARYWPARKIWPVYKKLAR